MKKLNLLLISLFLFFILNTNVYALQLGTPASAVVYMDDSVSTGTATVASWWGTSNYYAAPFRIGYFTPATYEARTISFLWSNSNLCSGQNLKISGSIGGLYNFFSENSYQILFQNNNQTMTCSYLYEESSRVSFTCVGTGGGSLYAEVNQLSFTSHNNYEIGITRDMSVSCEVTNLQVMQQEIINTQNIINSQNSNTQSIINNQNSNTSTITQNQDTNTQNIINNQNQNTQQEIESQKVCTSEHIDKDDIELDNSLLGETGIVYQNASSYGITKYFDVNSNSILNITNSISLNYCFYNSSKTLISCSNASSTGSVSIPNNASYFRSTIFKGGNQPQFDLTTCINGNQALSDNINDLTDSITSESQPNTSQDIQDMDDMVASDTPITDLITMPLTLVNAYINGMNSTCSQLNLGNLYGTDLILPCINLEELLGSNLWHIIDALFSIFLCYNIGMLFVSAFDGITSLRDDFEGLYQPRHADNGYQPRHGG